MNHKSDSNRPLYTQSPFYGDPYYLRDSSNVDGEYTFRDRWQMAERLIFDDRKEPLTVVDTDSTVTGKATLTGVELQSGQGKTYLLSEDGEYYLDPWNKREVNWVGITN